MKTAFVVILFAAAAFAQDLSVATTESACGPLNTKFVVTTDDGARPLQQPDPGKALVYVIEDQKFKAVNDVTVRIGLDGAWVGANLGNSYFSLSVEPGEHHLCTDWISVWLPNRRLVSLAPLTAEAGKTYYFRARTSSGRGAISDNGRGTDGASLDLDRVNSDEAKLLIASCALSVSHAKK
jgi:hypothetical protein